MAVRTTPFTVNVDDVGRALRPGVSLPGKAHWAKQDVYGAPYNREPPLDLTNLFIGHELRQDPHRRDPVLEPLTAGIPSNPPEHFYPIVHHAYTRDKNPVHVTRKQPIGLVPESPSQTRTSMLRAQSAAARRSTMSARISDGFDSRPGSASQSGSARGTITQRPSSAYASPSKEWKLAQFRDVGSRVQQDGLPSRTVHYSYTPTPNTIATSTLHRTGQTVEDLEWLHKKA